MTILCRSFGYSKQAYYRSQHLGSRLERECYLVSLVEEIRDDMPRLGGLKLWKLLNDNGVRIGRDELYDILRRRGLLVKRSKSRAITTDSRGWHRQHPNLVKGMDIYTTTGDHTLLSALILLRMYTNKKGMNLQ